MSHAQPRREPRNADRVRYGQHLRDVPDCRDCGERGWITVKGGKTYCGHCGKELKVVQRLSVIERTWGWLYQPYAVEMA